MLFNKNYYLIILFKVVEKIIFFLQLKSKYLLPICYKIY